MTAVPVRPFHFAVVMTVAIAGLSLPSHVLVGIRRHYIAVNVSVSPAVRIVEVLLSSTRQQTVTDTLIDVPEGTGIVRSLAVYLLVEYLQLIFTMGKPAGMDTSTDRLPLSASASCP